MSHLSQELFRESHSEPSEIGTCAGSRIVESSEPVTGFVYSLKGVSSVPGTCSWSLIGEWNLILEIHR